VNKGSAYCPDTKCGSYPGEQGVILLGKNDYYTQIISKHKLLEHIEFGQPEKAYSLYSRAKSDTGTIVQLRFGALETRLRRVVYIASA
jgi:hypothetical protein